jgi:uncharacterized protein DUF4304
LTKSLKPLGFKRRKTSWWQIRSGRLWHRLHIHKFSHGNSFRVHAAIHACDFEDDAPWLNGPSSHDGWYEIKISDSTSRRFIFRFQNTPEDLKRCADELRDYIKICVLPWFNKWENENALLTESGSPLTAEAKEFFRNSR